MSSEGARYVACHELLSRQQHRAGEQLPCWLASHCTPLVVRYACKQPVGWRHSTATSGIHIHLRQSTTHHHLPDQSQRTAGCRFSDAPAFQVRDSAFTMGLLFGAMGIGAFLGPAIFNHFTPNL